MSTKRVRLQKIVEKTEGYSGAELKATCVEAGMIAIRDGRSSVTNDDLMLAVTRLNEKKTTGGRSTTPDRLYS
jgi:ATP-dependent 26S proteasome regulatory subunit